MVADNGTPIGMEPAERATIDDAATRKATAMMEPLAR